MAELVAALPRIIIDLLIFTLIHGYCHGSTVEWLAARIRAFCVIIITDERQARIVWNHGLRRERYVGCTGGRN